MLGLKLGIENIPQFSGGGRPPLYSDLTFYSKERIDEFVKNKLDATGDSDAELVGRKYTCFNGTTWVDLGRNINLDFVPKFDSWSFECYFKTDNFGGGTIYSYGSGASQRQLQIGISSGKLLLYAGSIVSTGITIVTDNIWHKININCVGATYNTYIDDVLEFENAPVGTFVGIDNGNIGSRTSGGFLFNGCIMGVKFTKGNNFSNWLMNSGSTTICYDSGNNAIHGTFVGVPTYDKKLDESPLNIGYGCTKIVGTDVEIPTRLDINDISVGLDATGNTLTNPATSKIVSNVDGYILMPVIAGLGELSIFDKSNTTIYNTVCTDSEYFLGDINDLTPDAEELAKRRMWHISELETVVIQSYTNAGYDKFFATKNTYDSSYEYLTLKEIMAYDRQLTDEEYLKLINYTKDVYLRDASGDPIMEDETTYIIGE